MAVMTQFHAATRDEYMRVKIRGAREHNLKNIDVDLGDGLTAVCGVSGSGKTSLIFDTLYNESRRRFLEVFNASRETSILSPSDVDSVTGVGPTIAVGQNLLNRNPNSTLASAAGMHPFLRILFARFGVRHCPSCGAEFSRSSEDEIVEKLRQLARGVQSRLEAYSFDIVLAVIRLYSAHWPVNFRQNV